MGGEREGAGVVTWEVVRDGCERGGEMRDGKEEIRD